MSAPNKITLRSSNDGGQQQADEDDEDIDQPRIFNAFGEACRPEYGYVDLTGRPTASTFSLPQRRRPDQVNEVLNYKLAELLQERLDIKRSDGKWLQISNMHGHTYWCHEVTGEARWMKPKHEEIDEESKWTVCATEDDPNQLYYYNPTTEESRWVLCTYSDDTRARARREWRHYDDEDAFTSDEDISSSSDDNASSSERRPSLLTTISGAGANVLNSLKNRLVRVTSATSSEVTYDVSHEESAVLLDTHVDTPFGVGTCTNLREDKVWVVQLSGNRSAYCAFETVRVGGGRQVTSIASSIDVDAARRKAEEESFHRLSNDIRDRFPPPSSNADENTERGLIPMLRTFVEGFSEGMTTAVGTEESEKTGRLEAD